MSHRENQIPTLATSGYLQEALGISRPTLTAWIESGEMPPSIGMHAIQRVWWRRDVDQYLSLLEEISGGPAQHAKQKHRLQAMAESCRSTMAGSLAPDPKEKGPPRSEPGETCLNYRRHSSCYLLIFPPPKG